MQEVRQNQYIKENIITYNSLDGRQKENNQKYYFIYLFRKKKKKRRAMENTNTVGFLCCPLTHKYI